MDSKVGEYIRKQPSPQKAILTELRRIILKTLPKIEEEMKWGVPTYDEGRFYIVGLKDHCNVGFSSRGLTKEEERMFDGHAKTTVHLEVAAKKDIDEKRIKKLLRLVMARSAN